MVLDARLPRGPARRTRAVLDEFGLNDTMAGVLWMLDPDHPPAGMRELARRIGCDPSNVTLISDRLEAAGLVERTRSSADERLLAVTLTAEGLRLREQALAIPGAVMERLGMGLDQLTDLRDALTQVIVASSPNDRKA